MKEIIGQQITGYQHKENLKIVLQASVYTKGFIDDFQPDQDTVICKAEIIRGDK